MLHNYKKHVNPCCNLLFVFDSSFVLLVEANFYCENLKMLGKTLLKLGNKKKAKYWLEKAVNYNCKTADDKQVILYRE